MLRHVLIAAIAVTVLVGGITYTNRFTDWMSRTSEQRHEDERTWRFSRRMLESSPEGSTDPCDVERRKIALRELEQLEARHPEWKGRKE